ncbi:MAG: hypothetical protein FJ147_07830 [Deltaproteobacteria bacterium]|nr:hypothetical protein [Deltaproteobacteria bacterium]
MSFYLKGCSLSAVWPNHLTAEELFTTLTLPKRENLYGAYQSFLLNNLAPHLQQVDLPAGLQWIERKQSELRIADSFRSLSDALMLQAWEHLDVPEVIGAFVRVALLRLEEHEGIFCHRPDLQSEKTLQGNKTRRRQLLATILEMLCETGKEVDVLFYGNSHLVLETDIPWMIECLQSTPSEKIQQAWAQTIERCFNWSDRSQSNAILTACQEIPILAEVFAWFLKPVELGSPAAEKMKAAYLEKQRWENRTQKKPLLDPPPTQRIGTLLNAFEQGNLEAWWQLNMEMALRSNGSRSHGDLEPDLTILPGWASADSLTKQRILEAAKKYVAEQKPEIHRWLESNSFHRPTFAGYKALRLLQQEEPDWLRTLTTEVWQKWAPTILAYPLSSGIEQKKIHRELLKHAYNHAPSQIIETLLALIDKENKEPQGQISILREVECCWDDRLTRAVLKKSQDEQLKPKALGYLLCSLLDHYVEEAKILAANLISSHTASDQGKKIKAIITASALLTHADDAGWSIVWPALQKDTEFGREVVATAVYDFREKVIPITQMAEDQLADFYVWLSRQYPHADDPQREDGGWVSARDEVSRFRDSVLLHLKDRGTLAAGQAIQTIARELPQLDWLKWTLLEAQHVTRQRTWIPPKPSDILAIARNQQGRLVQSGEQLLAVLSESLQRLEQRLQGETPQVEFLWDQIEDKHWKPKDENSFSKYVKNHLDLDLKQKGIIVNREVEIRRKKGGIPGERVDIQADAVSKKPNGEEYDQISVVIEVKGCWHDELNEAMKTQLIDRYLHEARCQHGLYLVGWFNCRQWTTSDSRQKKAPKLDVGKIREKFDAQAAELSQSGVMVKAFVMNTALR